MRRQKTAIEKHRIVSKLREGFRQPRAADRRTVGFFNTLKTLVEHVLRPERATLSRRQAKHNYRSERSSYMASLRKVGANYYRWCKIREASLQVAASEYTLIEVLSCSTQHRVGLGDEK